MKTIWWLFEIGILSALLMTACSAAEAGAGGAGGTGGAGGGAGGSGGDGVAIPLPEVSAEQLAAFEKSLTAGERAQLDQYLALSLSISKREVEELKGNGKLSKQQLNNYQALVADEAAYRKNSIAELNLLNADNRAAFFKSLPEEMLAMRRGADPFYVAPEEESAAQKLGAEIQNAAAALLSDNVEAYILARRKVLSYGPDCRAAVAAVGRKAGVDEEKSRRIQSVLGTLDAEAKREAGIRIVATVASKLSALKQARPKDASGSLAAMISRKFVADSRDAEGDLVYFSFPKGVNGYKGAVSLQFDNGIGEFDVRMYGGQKNSIKDMGAVDFAGIKSAPAADEMDEWSESAAPVIGHVYIEHCFETGATIDATYKFRVLDLKPGEWVIIEYAKIPQAKE